MPEPSPHPRTLAARFRAAGRIVLALALLITLSLTRGVAGTAGAVPGTWVLTRNTLGLIAGADPSIAGRFFTSTDSLVLGGWPGAVYATSWSSYATFAADLEAGTIPGQVQAVMYDPEGWAATPLWEQQDPVAYMEAFSDLAHRHGYAVILTPHPNLTTVPGARCQVRPGETMEDAYLRCRIPALAATFADTLDLQAQYLEADPSRYRAVVALATGQARAANPRIVVVSQLSTTFAATPDVLYAAWAAVRDVVDGHYLGIPRGLRADVAVEFLRMVDERED